MKHSNNKLEEFKSEPYATTVGPEDAVEADKRTDHRNRISAARRRAADALNATRR